MSTGSTGSTFSKRQIAILLGVPATVALAYYIYRKKYLNNDDLSEKEKLVGKKEKKESAASAKEEDEEERRKRLAQEALKFKEKGNELYRRGKFDEAISNYDKAIEICPKEKKHDLAIFYQNRAASYEMLQKWIQVINDCTNSLECNIRYSKAYIRRAKAFQQSGYFYDALDDLTASCILDTFQNKKAIEDVDLVLRIIAEKDALHLLENRVPDLPSKHFIKIFLSAFVMDPIQKMKVYPPKDGEPTGFIRAKLALDSENYDDIISACDEEINSNSEDNNYKTEARLLRGTMYTLMGEFKNAEEDLNVLIRDETADPNLRSSAFIRRATLYLQTNEKEKAFEDYESAAKLTPDNPDIYHNKAQIHILLDEVDKALKNYEKVLKLAPDHAMAYVQKCYADYKMACASCDQWKLVSVMNDFINAVEKYPNCVECYSLIAQVLCDQERYDEANVYFEKALKVDPLNATLYVHHGVMMLQWKGDVNKAIELINKSIEVDDKCEFAYEMLGTIYVQRAELSKAVEIFDKAIKTARSLMELTRLCALKSAAVAQLNVTAKLGIDIAAVAGLCK